jgi:hypothetical protein
VSADTAVVVADAVEKFANLIDAVLAKLQSTPHCLPPFCCGIAKRLHVASAHFLLRALGEREIVDGRIERHIYVCLCHTNCVLWRIKKLFESSLQFSVF